MGHRRGFSLHTHSSSGGSNVGEEPGGGMMGKFVVEVEHLDHRQNLLLSSQGENNVIPYCSVF